MLKSRALADVKMSQGTAPGDALWKVFQTITCTEAEVRKPAAADALRNGFHADAAEVKVGQQAALRDDLMQLHHIDN